MTNLATDLARVMEFAKDQLQRHVDMLLQECDCEECPECGKLPHECSGTTCAQSCQCTTCDHCLASDAIDGLTDAIADLNTRAASGGDSASLEQRARSLFEAQADPHDAPWDRQWEPTKQHWRNQAAALANQQGVGRWQPIETAPQGTMILLADMTAKEARHWSFVGWKHHWNKAGHVETPSALNRRATHWKHLPEPPTQPAGDVGSERA